MTLRRLTVPSRLSLGIGGDEYVSKELISRKLRSPPGPAKKTGLIFTIPIVIKPSFPLAARDNNTGRQVGKMFRFFGILTHLAQFHSGLRAGYGGGGK